MADYSLKRLAIIFIVLLAGLNCPTAHAQKWGSVNVDTDSITVMAGALALDGQPNWFYYNGGDAPEGAYMGWLNQSQQLAGTVHFPQQLSPGRYYAFFYGISYDSNVSLQASMNGVSTPVVANDRDANGYWTDRAVLDVAASSDTLQIILTRNPAITADQRYLFRGIYITTNDTETVDKNSVAIKLVYPTVMDDSVPVKGNLIPNGGFETGVDSSWGFPGQGGGRTVPVNTMWDPTQGYEGQASLKLTFDSATRIQPTNSTEEIISRVYHLKPNKKYTLSMWLKASPGLTTTATVSLRNTYVPPPGYPAQYSISSGAVTISDSWNRVSVTGYLLEYPSSDYQIYIDSGGPSGTYLSIDAVQLEEGDLTSYAPAAEVEAGLVMDNSAKSGNIFYTDESLSANLVVRNNTGAAKTKALHFEIYDYANRIVRNGTLTLSLPANSTQTSSFDLNTGKQGIFRVTTWVENEDRSERELVYSIIPRPLTMSSDPTSFLGIHANYNEPQLKTLQRLGIKWSRIMSPSTFCRWSVVEPVEGQFVWYDNEVQLANSYGITSMCTVGTNNYWPAWADNHGLPNLDKWQAFVGQLVAHYKPYIKTWEIWNESYQVFPPDFYAQMLKRAADAIEANDPSATIVGMGGDPPAYIQSAISSLQTLYPSWDWKQHIHVLSTHDYPDGVSPESLGTILSSGVPVWNTETGAWDLGFYQGVNSNFVAWGKNLWPHVDASRYYNGMIGAADQVTTNFLRTIASGQSKYFYYDSRFFAAPNYFKHHPTVLDYDGTVKAKGIAYAIAGSLIDHSTALGNASSDPNSYLLVFDKPSGPVAALFTADKKPRQITLSTSQFQVFDMMGNPLPSGTTVPYGRIPVYLKGIGISALALKSALQAGTIAMRADNMPPTVSISDAPRGPIADSAFRVRWIGLDDSSYPNLGEINPESNSPSDTPNPNAILYSYYLNGYSSSWSPWSARTYADFFHVPTGSYLFSVIARDEAGNQSDVISRSVVIGTGAPPSTNDTTPPAVSITVPASGTTVAGTVVVTAAASDNVGVTGVQFKLDGANLGSQDTAAPYSVSWNTTGVSNGLHYLSAVAYDGAGNQTTAATVTLTVSNSLPDTTPPAVSITSPVGGSSISGPISVSAGASDNVGIVGVQFVLDGANLNAEVMAPPYSTSWNPVAASNGGHTLTAVARDAAGNKTTSAGISVSVSTPCVTSAPTVTLSPSSPSAFAGDTVSFTVSVVNNDVGSCAGKTFNVESVIPSGWPTTLSKTSMTIAPSSSVSFSMSKTVPASTPAGTYAVSLLATGLSSSTTGNASLTVKPPISIALSVGSGSYSKSSTVSMTAMVRQGSSGVYGSSVQFTLVLPNGSTSIKTVSTDATGQATWRYRIGPKDLKGVYAVTARATMGSQTANSNTVSFTIQ